MQATNKSDATQVYEEMVKTSKVGSKGFFKYILKPLTIFSYHYFLEGIKAVQKDGPTKELSKLTNLSYDETIRVMKKCQEDGIRVVASERKITNENSEFGKKKSMYQQKRITKYARRVKKLSDLKVKYPKIVEFLRLNKLIEYNKNKQIEQIEAHKDKKYNIYYNKSKETYMADRIADIIEYRTAISEELFDKDTQEAVQEYTEKGIKLNAQQLKDMSEKMKLHEMGEVEIENFTKDYCIHEVPFSAYMNISDDLEVAHIPFGVKVVKNEDDEKIANIYFENKHLERYSELGFNTLGQIHVYGTEKKNMQWSIKSKDEIVSFKTKTGDEEKQTYETLKGKNYIMKRQENECLWTVMKEDLKELAEKEKKRDVVKEDLDKLHIFEQLEKENSISQINTQDVKEIEVDYGSDIEKEVGD